VLTNSKQDSATANIYAIEPMLNQSSRSIQARALLQNPDQRFIPGNFAEVAISLTESDNTLFVPAESLILELNTHVVYKVKDGRARRQEVEIGTRTPDRVQILQGLAPGDTVLVTGLLEVRDGQEVRVKKLKEDGAL
jgi:membrane fusion protein (multidrug efflux system)